MSNDLERNRRSTTHGNGLPSEAHAEPVAQSVVQLKSALRGADGYDAQTAMLAPGSGSPVQMSVGGLVGGVSGMASRAIGAAVPYAHLGGPAGIKRIQQALTDAGYDAGGADGMMGPKTRAAISAFQQANGLTADGVPGAQTLDALGILPKGGGGGQKEDNGGGGGGGGGGGIGGTVRRVAGNALKAGKEADGSSGTSGGSTWLGGIGGMIRRAGDKLDGA